MITVVSLPIMSAFRWGASAPSGGGGTPTAATATYIPTFRPRRGR